MNSSIVSYHALLLKSNWNPNVYNEYTATPTSPIRDPKQIDAQLLLVNMIVNSGDSILWAIFSSLCLCDR